jgi:hypothetical protein
MNHTGLSRFKENNNAMAVEKEYISLEERVASAQSKTDAKP